MPIPIFVVGWRRAGTTLLANLIAQHSKVTIVNDNQMPGDLGGAFESVFFSHLAGKYGDLKHPNNLIRFIEIFGSSSYFELTGLDKEFMFAERPETYAKLFRVTMDKFAEKNGADWWVEKSPPHSFHIEELSRFYDDAKFVAVKRNVVEQVRSAIGLLELIGRVSRTGVKRKLKIVREVLAYYGAYKHIERFQKQHPSKIILIAFEDLIKSRIKTIMAVCDFLQLDFQPQMLESQYKPATSFKSEIERIQILSPMDVKMIHALSSFCTRLPYPFYRILYVAKRTIHGQKLPDFFFITKVIRSGWNNIEL